MKYRICGVVLLFPVLIFSALGNLITKSDFNFGHQLGFLYSRMDSASFAKQGTWNFETGLLGYYTSEMPLVRNSAFRERLMLTMPLAFEWTCARNVALQFAITDLFVEFPYHDIHSMGGKSPRFMAKIGISDETVNVPALALTIGVKFSSAKPFTIWENEHNYDESNGLAGACTGVADYLLLFTASKHFSHELVLNARLGLLPLGSPVEYVRGSGQADEIPYGLSIQKSYAHFVLRAEIAGMASGLESTRLAHYSVFRLAPEWILSRNAWTLNLEKGLTSESDEWVVGFRFKRFWGGIDEKKKL